MNLPGAETMLVEVERMVANSPERHGALHDTLCKWIRYKRGGATMIEAQCPHVTLKRQNSGSFRWYECRECSQKFQSHAWDGKAKVVRPDEITARIKALTDDYSNLDADLDDLDDDTVYDSGPWNRARGWYEALTWMRDRK